MLSTDFYPPITVWTLETSLAQVEYLIHAVPL